MTSTSLFDCVSSNVNAVGSNHVGQREGRIFHILTAFNHIAVLSNVGFVVLGSVARAFCLDPSRCTRAHRKSTKNRGWLSHIELCSPKIEFYKCSMFLIRSKCKSVILVIRVGHLMCDAVRLLCGDFSVSLSLSAEELQYWRFITQHCRGIRWLLQTWA